MAVFVMVGWTMVVERLRVNCYSAGGCSFDELIPTRSVGGLSAGVVGDGAGLGATGSIGLTLSLQRGWVLAGSKGRELRLQMVAVMVVVKQLMTVRVTTAIVAIILRVDIAASRAHLLLEVILSHKIVIVFTVVLSIIGYHGWEV
jgi:hypothetical protein